MRLPLRHSGSWPQPLRDGSGKLPRRGECDQPDKHLARTLFFHQPFFSNLGYVLPPVASLLLLLLLAGDVETNPGPSCYPCGQSFHQSDTPLACHAPDCGIRTHKQTRCSGVPHLQQSLPWHCPTDDGPGPPVTTQTFNTCYSCHHPSRQSTRPLGYLAQGCMNLAHAARRCSGPTAPPDQWCYFQHRNVTETVASVSASVLTFRGHARNHKRITCGGRNRSIAGNTRPLVCNDCSTAYHCTCYGLSRDEANTIASTGHWACPRYLATSAPLSAQPLTSRFVSEPKHHQCRHTVLPRPLWDYRRCKLTRVGFLESAGPPLRKIRSWKKFISYSCKHTLSNRKNFCNLAKSNLLLVSV